MERTFYYKVGRFLQSRLIKIKKIFTIHKKVRFPKNLTEQQLLAVRIFFSVLKNPKTIVYPPSSKDTEWCLYLKEENYRIVLNDEYLRIVNSVYSFDIPVTIKLEFYLIERIHLELTKRKILIKVDIDNKVKGFLTKHY